MLLSSNSANSPYLFLLLLLIFGAKARLAFCCVKVESETSASSLSL